MTTKLPKISPFALPNDKDVFLARDTEKARKKDQKIRTQSLKIWEKKTASTRMDLKRFKDEDIPAADPTMYEQGYSGNERDQILEAKRIVKSRVNYPKESRP